MIFLLRTSSSPALMRGTLLRSQVRDKVPHSEPLRSRSFISTITGSNLINTPPPQDQTSQYRSATVNEVACRISAIAESAQQSMNTILQRRGSPPSPCNPSSSTPPPTEARTSIDYLKDTHTTTPYTSPPTPATRGSDGGGGDIISSTFLSDGEGDADMNKYHRKKGDEEAEGEEREGHAHPHEEEDDEGEEDEGGEVERAM